MLCEKCQEREASVFFVEIKNKEKEQHSLCDVCSHQASSYIEKPTFSYSLHDLLNQFLQIITSKAKENIAHEAQGLVCDFCHLSYKDFQQTGRLGCASDYTIFRKFLDPLILNLHGKAKHTGKKPKEAKASLKYIEDEMQLADLQKQLKEAIAEERYEDAALFRDKIMLLERRMHGTR